MCPSTSWPARRWPSSGASGSRKVPLLGLLAGLDSPSGGTVRIRGRDLFALDEDGRAALCAVCLRGLRVPVLSALAGTHRPENVMLPLELAGVATRCPEAEAWSWLGRAGPGGLGITQRPGFRWRAAAGRGRPCLAPGLALVLADEPTGNLDVATGERSSNDVFLSAESGTTLVLVTHDTSAGCGREVSACRRAFGGLSVSRAGTTGFSLNPQRLRMLRPARTPLCTADSIVAG